VIARPTSTYNRACRNPDSSLDQTDPRACMRGPRYRRRVRGSQAGRHNTEKIRAYSGERPVTSTTRMKDDEQEVADWLAAVEACSIEHRELEANTGHCHIRFTLQGPGDAWGPHRAVTHADRTLWQLIKRRVRVASERFVMKMSIFPQPRRNRRAGGSSIHSNVRSHSSGSVSTRFAYGLFWNTVDACFVERIDNWQKR